MRTTILALLIPIASGTVIHAQDAVRMMPHLRDALEPTHEATASQPAPGKHEGTGTTKASVVQLGRMQNAYSMQRPGNHQVSYVPELNSVVFVRRQNAADHGNLGGASLRFDHSTDGGTTWQLGTLLTPTAFAGGVPNSNGLRHPNGFLYNPPGNTDPQNAYVVAQAPNVYADPVNQFNNLMHASARLDGADAHDEYVELWDDVHETAWVQGLQMAGNGHAWSIATTVDNANTVNSRRFFKINKGAWNNSTNRMDWTVAGELTDDFTTYESDGSTYTLNLDWSVSFSPDGQTGYAVVIGGVDNGPPANVYPVVWRSTDAGVNWEQLPLHDFSQDQVFIDHLFPANGSQLVRPFFDATSITVDGQGRLHVFSEVLSGFHSSPDSAQWIFASIESQVLVHAMLDGVDDWTVELVSPVVNEPWEPWGAGALAQDAHPQICRTADGGKVFMAWNAALDIGTNEIPDVLAVAYDVNTGMYSETKVLTAGTAAELSALWFQMAPVCISGGDDHDFELPIAYQQLGATDLLPATAYYLKGVGFDEGEINVGMNEVRGSSALRLYPNPSAGRFAILLPDAGAADVTITDITGRVVLTQRMVTAQQWFDLAGWPSGMYVVNVTSERMRRSAKLILE